MATKILNLDDLEVGVEKSFILKGHTHSMTPLSVEAYLKQVKRLEAMKAEAAGSAEENLHFMIDTIIEAFPTVPREDLLSLSFERLNKLTEFINADLEAETEEGNAN